MNAEPRFLKSTPTLVGSRNGAPYSVGSIYLLLSVSSGSASLTEP